MGRRYIYSPSMNDEYIGLSHLFNIINQMGQSTLKRWLPLEPFSEEFIKNHRAFWVNASSQWTSTPFGDELSGTEIDNIYCAQDGDFKLYETAKFKIKYENETQAEAIFDTKKGEPIGDVTIFLIKKDEKWLISNLICH